MNSATTVSVVETRIKHAAHYMGSNNGHDLLQWDVAGSNWRPGQPCPVGVPNEAHYHVGYIDRAGEQHWVFNRVVRMSDGTCERCK